MRVTDPTKASRLKARGADLRDATITFELVPGKKPGPERKWSAPDLYGAKLGKTTRIEYAPLP
jgi:hypothetical protein